MIKLLFIIVFGTTATALSAQADNPKYDAQLAQSLGADEYGMKAYTLVILKTGKNTTDNKPLLDSLFRGHMTNIKRLADAGKLVVAGPIGKNDKSYRGIFILTAKNAAEANEMLQLDPAIKANVFDVELYPWYGSAALPEYLKVHEKIEKKKH
jgi:uncharacterized protein